MRSRKLPAMVIIISLFLLPGCSLPQLQCLLSYSNGSNYHFKMSKEELKDVVLASYSYRKSILSRILSKNIIENTDVNHIYNVNMDTWLNRKNWKRFKTEIRSNTGDTLHIIIGKHNSRKQIELEAVINGNNDTATLAILGFKYQRQKKCDKDTAFYRGWLSKKIEKRFISKLE